MIEWTSLIPLGTFFLAWLGFIEKRLHSMKEDVKDQLKEKEKIDKIVYNSFKEDINKLERTIERLEDKLDKVLDKI